MARILITGGAGYVGSHCAKALAAAGHEGIVFDSLLFGHRDLVRWGKLIKGDIRDAAALNAVFAAYRIDAVMHFAALAYVGESVQAPDRYYDVGIAEEHAVLFAAGMATMGYRPVCAIYSTFLQRAYDCILHDVALQDLPVIFCMDRAGLSANDGPTQEQPCRCR